MIISASKLVTEFITGEKFITGQNEGEESTQNTTVTKSAAYASYKIKATT
jgi:hypothetical protein